MGNTNKKGFTLIELIVVIALLAILAMILVLTLSGYMNKAKQAVADANARACYSAAMTVQIMMEVSTSPTIPDINAPYDEMERLGFPGVSSFSEAINSVPEDGKCGIIGSFGHSFAGTKFTVDGVTGIYKPN